MVDTVRIKNAYGEMIDNASAAPQGPQFHLIERISLAADGRFNYAVDCQRGLVLKNWMGMREFLSAFNECKAASIDVFWKAPLLIDGGSEPARTKGW